MNTFMRCLSLSVTLVTLMISATGSAWWHTPRDRPLGIQGRAVGPNSGIGALFSTGNGQLTLKINKKKREIVYQLTYKFPDAAATPIVGTQFVNQGAPPLRSEAHHWLDQRVAVPIGGQSRPGARGSEHSDVPESFGEPSPEASRPRRSWRSPLRDFPGVRGDRRAARRHRQRRDLWKRPHGSIPGGRDSRSGRRPSPPVIGVLLPSWRTS